MDNIQKEFEAWFKDFMPRQPLIKKDNQEFYYQMNYINEWHRVWRIVSISKQKEIENLQAQNERYRVALEILGKKYGSESIAVALLMASEQQALTGE